MPITPPAVDEDLHGCATVQQRVAHVRSVGDGQPANGDRSPAG
ncbi:MAG TPA: hypothetical protein VFT70_17900 [Nocardioides sp.]|nr:hypothetical protein [Nocardioides sp.]